MKKFGTRKLAFTGLMAATVFAGSMISIPVGSSRIHLGNSMILLAGFFLDAVPGGLAGGIGSVLYDAIIYGANPVNCLVTFVSKFLMGYFAGLLFKKTSRIILAGCTGEIAYIVIYVLKKYITYRFVNGTAHEAAMAAAAGALFASLFNAAAAVVISFILYKALRPAVSKILS